MARAAAWVVVAAVLFGILLAAPRASRAPRPCAPLSAGAPRLAIRVAGELPEPAVRHDLDANAISGLSKLTFAAGQRARGLTRIERGVSAVVRGRSQRRWGGVCFAATGVDLQIDYRAFEIYIDRDIAPGSCHYGTVYNHELEHALMRREEHARLKSALAAAVERAAPDAQRPAPARSHEAAPSEAGDRVATAARAALARLEAEAGAMDAQLDQPENLRALWTSCPDLR